MYADFSHCCVFCYLVLLYSVTFATAAGFLLPSTINFVARDGLSFINGFAIYIDANWHVPFPSRTPSILLVSHNKSLPQSNDQFNLEGIAQSPS